MKNLLFDTAIKSDRNALETLFNAVQAAQQPTMLPESWSQLRAFLAEAQPILDAYNAASKQARALLSRYLFSE